MALLNNSSEAPDDSNADWLETDMTLELATTPESMNAVSTPTYIDNSETEPAFEIVGPVRSTPTHLAPPESEGDTEFIVAVAGTDILLLRVADRLVCWDRRIAEPCQLPSLESHGLIVHVSSPLAVAATGEFSVAFLTSNDPHRTATHGHFATITHDAGNAVSFTTIAFEIAVSNIQLISAFIVEAGVGTEKVPVGGTVAISDGESELEITLWKQEEESQMSTLRVKIDDEFSETKGAVAFTFKDHLYHLIEDDHSVKIHHISRRVLLSPSRTAPGTLSAVSTLEIPGPESAPGSRMLPSAPLYGVAAVFFRCQDWDKNMAQITFVPTTVTDAPEDGASSPLVFDTPCVSHSLQGYCSPVWLDHSGCNLVLVSNNQLVLLRYHPDTQSISKHTLSSNILEPDLMAQSDTTSTSADAPEVPGPDSDSDAVEPDATSTSADALEVSGVDVSEELDTTSTSTHIEVSDIDIVDPDTTGSSVNTLKAPQPHSPDFTDLSNVHELLVDDSRGDILISIIDKQGIISTLRYAQTTSCDIVPDSTL
ncbi:hypothetical protein C8R46DRAFT_1024139 [Mycena filopes]|nr:hypothetical protein C8R46DRAFT_1024139 [Mycena filopes]